ncbi:MAG: hypothetical protein ACYC9Q_08385 [Bacillota bacterium]
MSNNIPKVALVSLIIRGADEAVIRRYFRIDRAPDLVNRLRQLSYSALIGFIQTAGRGMGTALKTALDDFPLRASPTLYLANVFHSPRIEEIAATAGSLARKKRPGGMAINGVDKPIRWIYVSRPLRKILPKPQIGELTVSYERRVDFVDGGYPSDKYGEPVTAWSLEKALVWLPGSSPTGAVIACTEIAAANLILDLLRTQFGLVCSLPDLTESMFKKITEGGRPRSATFSSRGDKRPAGIDAATVTLHDVDLPSTQSFLSLSGDRVRLQAAGYYTGQSDLLLVGGIGVSRRYAKIWTPRHLGRQDLSRLGVGILGRTQEELSNLRSSNTTAYLSTFGHHPVRVGGALLRGTDHTAFLSLVSLLAASSSSRQGIGVAPDEMERLIEHRKALKLGTGIYIECRECGDRPLVCPECGTAMEPYGLSRGRCPECSHEVELDGPVHCDCGAEVHVIPMSSMFLYPTPELISSLDEFLGAAKLEFAPLFVIAGGRLLLLHKARGAGGQLQLDDLDSWRLGPHFHTRGRPPEAAQREIISAIQTTREKCYDDGAPPSHDRCAQCIARVPSRTEVLSGAICLPRVFGLPIRQQFDGIHHGREVADIRYGDRVGGDEVAVGIHLKSHSISRPKHGLGRSNGKIKELYAQLFYSLHEVLIRRQDLDVLGVSIPNPISTDVITSMRSVTERLNVQFLALDVETWIKIYDSALEYIDQETEMSRQSATA